MYNILPVSNNLYKWGLADDRYCPKYHVIKDIVYVFIECEQNKNVLDHVQQVLMFVFKIEFCMNNCCFTDG